MLSTNETCSDKGMLDLGTINACRKARRALLILRPLRGPVDWGEHWPKACFYDIRGFGSIVYNIHPIGNPNRFAKPICRTG